MSKKFDLDAYKKNLKVSETPSLDVEMGFVYKIQHKVNSKIYIGITVRNLEQRWKEHGYKRTSKTCRSLINEAIQRDGKDSFTYEVVAIVPASILESVEANFIDHYESLAPKGYNSVKLTEGHKYGVQVSEKTRRKMSNSRKGKEPWNKGKKGAQEAWNKGIPNKSSMIPIVAINNTTGEVTHYESSVAAIKDLDLNSGHVTQCCKGKLKQHKGYTFKYKVDYDQGGSDVK